MLFALIAATVISTSPVQTSFNFAVHPGSATWTVEPVGAAEDEAHFELTALRIIERGSPDRLIQEIKLKSPEVLYSNNGWVEAEDFDFDGWRDLYVTTVGGSGGLPGLLMRFDPKTGRFLEPFRMHNAAPDFPKRVVHTGWRNGYCCSWEEDVRFIPGQFEPLTLRRMERSRADGPDAPIIETLTERSAKGKMKVVCRMELEDSVEQPVLRMIEGDPKRCLHLREEK